MSDLTQAPLGAETLVSNLTCPRCGGSAEHAGVCLYRQLGELKQAKIDYYRCVQGSKCPNGSDEWDGEFVIVDGEKRTVFPGPSEFA